MYIPDTRAAAEKAPILRGRIEELNSQRNQLSGQLTALTAEISATAERQRQWSDYLKEVQQSQQYRLSRLATANWKAMRGGDLEQFLEEVFSELRYSVERTGQAGDQGVDLVLLKDGHRIAVQVKGYVDSVPNTAIQEAFTGMAFYRCEACAVITNSRFTTGGKNIARTVGGALIDENKLPRLIMGQTDLWQEILTARAQPQPR
jgi:HJR/Mrr/RecB family endonuclease